MIGDYLMNIKNLYQNIIKVQNKLFLIEILFKFFFIIFIIPLINYIITKVMHKWGQSYLTIANLPSFLSYPPTLFILLLTFFNISIYIFFKMTTMLSFYSFHRIDRRPDLLQIIVRNIVLTRHCISSRSVFLPLYTLLLYVFTNIPILIGIVLNARIDFGRGASDGIFIKGLLLLIIILLGFIAYPGIFALNYFVNDSKDFFNSLKDSKKLLKGHYLETLKTLILINFILTIGYFVIYYFVLFLDALLTYLIADKAFVITVFLSHYQKLNNFLIILFSMISFVMNLKLIFYHFHIYTGTELRANINHVKNDSKFILTKKNRLLTYCFILLFTVYGINNFYETIKRDSFYLKEALPGILISSHRGNSQVSPENTLPALENAIIARSDYAEIDVRETKDGTLILLHDNNLLRTAGLNKKISKLTYAQIRLLDVGSWFGEEFRNTKIPTLNEAFKLCKGKIKLNIELKPNNTDHSIEEKLVTLIEKYDFVHQCQISSWDYETLKNIKRLNPEIKTGLILSAVYGDFYQKEYADFFSIRSGFITSNIVENAHKSGKEVHAWTVNTKNDIERMKSMGVDCIITNNPTLAKKILIEDDTNSSFIRLLNHMLRHRSFYRFVDNLD